MIGLENRTVIVVGAGGGGIGEAVVLMLGQHGCSVVAVDNDEVRLEATRQSSAASGGTPCQAVVADARDVGQVRQVVHNAAASGPPLHGLVHVVGGIPLSQWSRVVDYEPAIFDQVMTLNLNSTLYTSQAVARVLAGQGQGGSIVHVASISGLAAAPFNAAYGAAKAAVMSLTRTMAEELGPQGIRVNAVAPGTIARTGAPPDPELDRISRATIPLGRRGTPADVAGAATWLLSDLASFVSGQVITVDGGSSIKPSYLDEHGLPLFMRGDALRRVVEAKRDLGSSEPDLPMDRAEGSASS